MTNFEKIKNMSVDEIAEFLCTFVDEEIGDCDKCPATRYCKSRQNGFAVWLKQEADDEI